MEQGQLRQTSEQDPSSDLTPEQAAADAYLRSEQRPDDKDKAVEFMRENPEAVTMFLQRIIASNGANYYKSADLIARLFVAKLMSE